MNLQRLAAKQKRLKDWTLFQEAGVQNPALRSEIEIRLRKFKELLEKAWETKILTPEELVTMDGLERSLEALNEEARLQVRGKSLDDRIPARF